LPVVVEFIEKNFLLFTIYHNHSVGLQSRPYWLIRVSQYADDYYCTFDSCGRNISYWNATISLFCWHIFRHSSILSCNSYS